MANAPVTKYQVMAKCIQIMTKQMKDSKHPEMKRRLRERIDYLTSFGVIDNYRMMVYNNCVTLIHNDFKNNINLSLYDDGKLRIGRFDATLQINDPQCIRIHGDGTADSGACIHGYVEGECITESLLREKGKEVRYTYQSSGNPYNSFISDAKRVKNDMSLPLLKRLLKNETIGQGDFCKALLLMLGIFIMLAAIGLEFLLIIPGIFFTYLVYKRILDMGYSGGGAILLLILCYMFSFLGLLILAVMPSKVVSEKECNFAENMLSKELAAAENDLKARCDTYPRSIDWLLMNAETARIAASLAGDGAVTPIEDGDDALGENEEPYQAEEEEPQGQEDDSCDSDARREQISSLEQRIRSLASQMGSAEYTKCQAESQAASQRQQGETYLSYANSTQDEAQRNDYLQSADRCFSEAARYDSEAASAASTISSLQQDIDSLQNEIDQL